MRSLVKALGLPTEKVSGANSTDTIIVKDYVDSLLYQIYQVLQGKDKQEKELVLALCKSLK